MASVNQLLNQLEGLGTRVGSMNLHLLEASLSIVNEIKATADASFDRNSTKNLRNSIKAIAENNTLKIFMLYYGPFQNYGVIGSQNNRGVKQVPFGVNPRPSNGISYKFKNVDTPVGGPLSYRARLTIRRQGLEPKDFFDVDDIARELTLEIQERIMNLK